MHNDFLSDTESAYFVLNEDSADSGDHLTINKVSASNTAKIRDHLDGAIVFAWNTVKSNRKPPALTCTRWLWRLAASYHLCHSSSQLMEQAAQHFAASGRQRLAQWAAQKAREERGHDQLALLDIASMGYEASEVVKAFYPPSAKALVDYFTQSVQASDPIRCVGYIYTIERLGLVNKEEFIQTVKALLPPDVHATRCLHVHSSVGVEVEHVKDALEMLAGLSFEELTQVAIACYETALLCFSPPNESYISDEELQKVLRPLELHHRLQVKSDFQPLTK
jgi:hypothetical protein